MKKLFFILCVLLLAKLCFSANYYVSSAGSNTAPYDTWAKASTGFANLNSIDFADGDIINIRPGDTISDARLEIDSVTGSGKSLTVQGLDGDGKTLASDGKPIIDGNSNLAIKVYDTAVTGITLKNFKVNGIDAGNGGCNGDPWRTCYGMITLSDLTNITIDGVEMYGHQGASSYSFVQAAIFIIDLQSSPTVEIKNSIFRDYRPNPTTYPAGDWAGTGPAGWNNADAMFLFFDNIAKGVITGGTVSIHDNEFTGIWADSIQIDKIHSTISVYDNTFQGYGENALDWKYVKNSYVYRNTFDKYGYGYGGSGGGHAAFSWHKDAEVGAETENNWVYDNLFQNCDGYGGIRNTDAINTNIYNNYFDGCSFGVEIAGNSDNTKIYNNLFNMDVGSDVPGGLAKTAIWIYPSDADGILIYNNTIYSSHSGQHSGIYYNTYSGRTGAEIKNNIIYMTTDDKYPLFILNSNDTPTINYNTYYNSGGTERVNDGGTSYTTSNFSSWATGGHANDKSRDPLMTDAAGGDFTLQSGSLEIGSGENLGAAYDDGWHPNTALPPSAVSTHEQDDWERGTFVFLQTNRIQGITIGSYLQGDKKWQREEKGFTAQNRDQARSPSQSSPRHPRTSPGPSF